MPARLKLQSETDAGLLALVAAIAGDGAGSIGRRVLEEITEHGAQLAQMRAEILTKGNEMARTLDEVLDIVRESNTKADSVIALIDGVKAKLDEALKGERISAASQAKIDAIFDEVAAQRDELVAAVEANTEGGGAAPGPAPDGQPAP